MDKNDGTVADALAAVKDALGEFWAALNADERLDEEEVGDVTRLVDGASVDIDEAAKIVHANAERE